MTRPKSSVALKTGRRDLRIIGGLWRSRKIQFLDLPGLRPTPDRVRETVFNWLQLALAGQHVLDVFAGSGAMGFEALSRGAASLTLLERDPNQAACLREQAAKLGAQACEVNCVDSLHWLKSAQAPAAGYGLIFLDPPFHLNLVNEILHGLAQKGWYAQTQWVYVETELGLADLLLPSELQLHRQTKAGLVNAFLFRCSAPESLEVVEPENDTH